MCSGWLYLLQTKTRTHLHSCSICLPSLLRPDHTQPSPLCCFRTSGSGLCQGVSGDGDFARRLCPIPPPISWTESCFTWCLLISQPKQTAPHTTEHGHQFPCNINSLKSPIQTKNQSWWLLSWVFPVASFPPKYVIQNKLHNQKLHTSWLVLPNSSTLQLSSFSPKLFTDWRTYSSTVTAYCSGHIYLKELGALILWTNHNSVKVVIQSTVCRPYISGIMWRKNCVDWEYLCILILIIFHFCLFNGTYFSV